MRIALLSACAAIAPLVMLTNPSHGGEGPPVVVTSPDGRVRAEVMIGQDGGPAAPHLCVTLRGRPVLLASRLGVDLADGPPLGADSTIEGVETRKVDDAFAQFPGKRSRVVHKADEATIRLREKSGKLWQVVIRAADDGVALRYVFPAQEGWPALAVSGERTAFRFPERARAHALPLKSFTSSHEARYLDGPIRTIPTGQLLGLPLLAELPGTGWAAVAEADLDEYAGLYLTREGDALAARLSPLPKVPKLAVRSAMPHRSPWRVLLVGDKVERLVESDLILALNAPSQIPDTSWIKPGKTTFPWWNGFHEEPGKVPFKMGLNTETAKYYIDFCAEAGIPYHSLDGLDNIAWYGGTIVPYEGAGITKGLPGLDLKDVLAHAKSRGVKIRLWMHWAAAEKHMEKAFPLYREWGVEGVMLDFMDRDDQEMNRFLRRAVKLAADNHLTVTLHGVAAPTGLERTYPNLLTHAGVMNLEYDKWDKDGIPPEHELTIPFTRMLAGPLDFHQGSFRGVPVDQFRARDAAPLVMGTPRHMLASYVVFQNHLPMVADYPSAYRDHPEWPLKTLAKIPASWDDTRCLEAKVGEYVVIARRSGEDWWVGAMTDRHARDVAIPLGFLGDGRYRAEIDRDDPGAIDIPRPAIGVGAKDVLRERLLPSGGVVIRLTPAAP